MVDYIAKPEHEVVYQDLLDLLRKRGDKVSVIEMLAIASNMVGKFLAMQDQRTMNKDRALKIVIANIEAGNKQIIENLANESAGSA